MPTQLRRKTALSIFDLPLELRQSMYRECIPNGYQLRLNDDTTERKTIDDLRKAHPQISHELADEEAVRCTEVVFLVNSNEWLPPTARPGLCRLSHVQLTIELHEYIPGHMYHDDEGCSCWYDEGRRNGRMAKLEVMSKNLSNFVTWLKRSCTEATITSIRIGYPEFKEAPIWPRRYLNSRETDSHYELRTRSDCSLTKSDLPYCEETLAWELSWCGGTKYLHFNKDSRDAATLKEYLSFCCKHEPIYQLWWRLLCTMWEPGYVHSSQEDYFERIEVGRGD